MLLQDVQQFLKSVLDVEKVLRCVHMSQTRLDALCGETASAESAAVKFLNELKSWQNTLQQFITKTAEQYPLYKDLLSTFLPGVAQVRELQQ